MDTVQIGIDFFSNNELGDLNQGTFHFVREVCSIRLRTGNASTTTWYRVRKTWADSKSQKGAFHSLENAKKCADENAGYSVFDEAGNAVYPVQQQFTPYRVRVKINDLNIRKGPGTDCAKWGKYTGAGVFTIVEEADGPGATKWGLLKSYADKRNGWISLDYTNRL